MTDSLRRAFEPTKIRGAENPNRIVRTAHLTKLGMGVVSEEMMFSRSRCRLAQGARA